MKRLWIGADWPVPECIVAGTTLRHGGVSEGVYSSLNLAGHVGDDPECVAENRRRFMAACGLPAEPAWLHQVHGNQVIRAESQPMAREGDAIQTRRAGLVCAVLTADCLPVLLAAEDGTEIAAAHAGWRGLSAGILERSVAAFEASPDRLLAWFGPAISQPAFEVGEEVRDRFVCQDKSAADLFVRNASGRWQADLYGLAALRLGSTGVTRLYGGGWCTHADRERFFSYRRDGYCGRMATFIFRREQKRA